MDRCHLKITNAEIIDGSGARAWRADVAIEGERIAAIGNLAHWQADEKIEAQGLVLAPGFIDVHTHDDMAVLKTPDMDFKISQGVTTVVAGNCGISAAPFTSTGAFPPPFPLLGDLDDFAYPTVSAYREAFGKAQPSINLALLTGHSTLRVAVMPDRLDQAATENDIAGMSVILKQALEEGSIGLSTGLDYPPATHAPMEEIIALARVVSDADNAIYATHMRNEGDRILDAIDETLQTGRDGGVPVVISHHKCSGKKNHGRSVETLARLAAAPKGQQVGLDVYPYTASSTTLLPRYLRDCDHVLVTYSDPHPECAGRRLDEIAGDWNLSQVEAAEKLYPAGAIYFQMDEADLKRIMAFPSAMIGSDGLPGQPKPHPRLWGTFPRVLGRYVRQEKTLGLEQAVHKMTGLSAKTFNLKDRGLVRPDYFADLVLFDPETVIDTATYDDPVQPAAGIAKVFVNGTLGWANQAAAGPRTGCFLARVPA